MFQKLFGVLIGCFGFLVLPGQIFGEPVPPDKIIVGFKTTTVLKGENGITGTAALVDIGTHLYVEISLKHAPPGLYGVHLQKSTDCSGLNPLTGAPHLNPLKKKHGSPEDKERHLGDFGNIEISQIFKDGRLRLMLDKREFPIRSTVIEYIIATAVVIDKNPDDFNTQPSGDSGGPMACGILGDMQAF